MLDLGLLSLENDGICIVNKYIHDLEYLDYINSQLYIYLEQKQKEFNRTDNCLHHILCYDKILLEKLLIYIASLKVISDYFKVGFIMHSCGAVINKPSLKSYTHNWHIDTYEETNENMMLNVLVPLCDFTLENGCTKIIKKNSNNTFIDILLDKGSILLFNSSLKHCTGENKSNNDRNCLTITLIKPYLKPQFNYLSLFSEEELINKDEDLKKIYNYYSQTPEHLEDFYNKKYKLNML